MILFSRYLIIPKFIWPKGNYVLPTVLILLCDFSDVFAEKNLRALVMKNSWFSSLIQEAFLGAVGFTNCTYPAEGSTNPTRRENLLKLSSQDDNLVISRAHLFVRGWFETGMFALEKHSLFFLLECQVIISMC